MWINVTSKSKGWDGSGTHVRYVFNDQYGSSRF